MKERLRQILSQRRKLHITDTGRVAAAVLVPLFHRQGNWHILFIKRTEKVKYHKGQISFPGGNREKGEPLLATALRECQEEIGLQVGDTEVLGELDDELTTTSNYIVTPFVAAIPWPYHFRLNEDEVEEIIEIPIAALRDRACLRQDTEILNGKTVPSYTYLCQGRVIWGATARILNRFLDIIQEIPEG
jgi:8-oxo-dGTP pyrophosphatase MutT (NUDIX family)